ncbi:MAG: glycosyltransferase [bacterium]|nr:glycosyltransferase [bacterium]
MSNPLVTINLVVLNGEKYIRHCLDGILAQTYPKELTEFNILDNGSLDNNISIIENLKLKNQNAKFLKWDLIKSEINLGMWPGQEELLKYSNGKYILALAVDVILDKNFIKNAVEAMERDSKIGALQAKIYKYDLASLPAYQLTGLPAKIIDTCGFRIFKSRRLINIGHGEEDKGQYDNLGEIFGVEGAAPFFRREAVEDIRINEEFCDHDYFWYGDDLDFAWRMNLFGWKQVFVPSVIAWHDRQTTKKLRQNFRDFLAIRKAISLRKRQLEWKNIRFTIVKNDYIINILKDLPYVVKREVMMLGYLIFFEPRVFLEIPSFLKLLPRMMAKRKEIMRKAKVSPAEIRKYFK